MSASPRSTLPIPGFTGLKRGPIRGGARWWALLLGVALAAGSSAAAAGVSRHSGGRPPVQLALLVLAVVGTALWLRLMTARRWARDREADARLQVLTDRTCLAQVDVLAVHATDWSSIAGQHALTIDLATGQPECVWFSQAHFPSGALVLVDRSHDVVRPLDWMLPDEVAAAYRHRRRSRRLPARAARARERRAASGLIRSARESEAGPLMQG